MTRTIRPFCLRELTSIKWIYPSELLPLKLRLRGGAIAVVSQWLWTFLVVEITPVMITNIGYKSYIVFAIINFVTVPFVSPLKTCGLRQSANATASR